MSRAYQNIEYIRPYSNKKYTIIIPAAGMGYRINYHVKSLLDINGKTLIERQLNTIHQVFKQKEIIVVLGHRAETVQEKTPLNLIKVVNKDYAKTNVVHSIGEALNHITTPRVIIIYGDLFFNAKAISLPFRNESAVVLSQTMSKKEVGVNEQAGKLINMYYELDDKWGQIAYYTEKELSLLGEVCRATKNKRMFGFECINEILDMGGKFNVFRPKNSITYDIDSFYDLNYVRKNYANIM